MATKDSETTGTTIHSAAMKQMSTPVFSKPKRAVKGPKDIPPKVIHNIKEANTSPSGGTEFSKIVPSTMSMWVDGANFNTVGTQTNTNVNIDPSKKA
eukprot:CAMPEP_0114340664 /NCGR_PEP_ID=MMETSP0101-20121206/8526_1 /TAXON_ID=38822 ORGANISM="Pteridomonas danica, Strain PT" /NCGR_SAMPLE_ID=MMETSP0101 /ASSEMBLY_ACC=CAM_ASM_000211 /LENGTH=96 /DNA_ID=CAMNT_0001473999 /DNA_START=473 /DNA_END=763 /DNA_ORIENTATION=+